MELVKLWKTKQRLCTYCNKLLFFDKVTGVNHAEDCACHVGQYYLLSKWIHAYYFS